MKLTVHIVLFTLWVFALTAPSLVAIYNNGEHAVFVINLGEEEQEEKVNKDISEEKIVPSEPYSKLFAGSRQNKTSIEHYILGITNHSPDIALPPPEPMN